MNTSSGHKPITIDTVTVTVTDHSAAGSRSELAIRATTQYQLHGNQLYIAKSEICTSDNCNVYTR